MFYARANFRRSPPHLAELRWLLSLFMKIIVRSAIIGGYTVDRERIIRSIPGEPPFLLRRAVVHISGIPRAQRGRRRQKVGVKLLVIHATEEYDPSVDPLKTGVETV